MKIRQGFVSNSSSSSFLLFDKTVSLEDFTEIVKQLWEKYEPKSAKNMNKLLRLVDLSEEDKPHKKFVITHFYADECWNAFRKDDICNTGNFCIENRILYLILWRLDQVRVWIYNTFFAPTYLDQALKAHIFGVGKDNAVPYEVQQELRKIYKNKIKIHHLG